MTAQETLDRCNQLLAANGYLPLPLDELIPKMIESAGFDKQMIAGLLRDVGELTELLRVNDIQLPDRMMKLVEAFPK